ncbi:hypothetical protein COX67_04215 [Candidatus Falkowbacteria bacterium CG_4_10_14_0_2_um_filter_36_22]|uniref:DUF2339 domain-containing protein n=2 Tax=Candidatus Falkowiibacteriota TaxID=1752728 RepID=A0A1J4T819_9BACT|nr:MAG: hypothetical protein AUJ27_03255 [Candidatus Falkowbacteria bacterium CG1_02_37_44]PIV50491.1 MAG: hypothetical protein COS18_04885 [Candidatus Falkowbacteria bacterium CG02_land_8_20_14_3_00_36_14]PIX10966.1 MAG: hypothetical protein COZ73_03915 [Candidatus Falkowbacteria bacterium CG_4_8_14_3_um_filter_36_11]PJA10570.1 MAG: hypothetical protein COX67_04215 [Candidatus Falkowbacteria bacterium CG_4_10_14_0_2_um_filter_36_22]
MPEEKNSIEIFKFLGDLKKAVLLLDEKINNQNKKIENLENKILIIKNDADNKGKSVQQKETFRAVPPSPPLSAPEASFKNSIFKKLSNKGEGDNIGLEEKIGGKWFAKIGIAAIVIGVSFFLKYAFDNNWIGETGRVIIGIIAGLGLLFLGEKTIRKYATYGQIISGGGIAVLYLSIFAAYNFYHLIPQLLSFFVMAVITAIGFLLSLRYNAVSLMAVAILGGFATPFLISTGVNNQFGLFFYILILDIAILVISIFKKWRELNIIGYIGTVIVFIAWGERFYTDDQLLATIFFLSLFFIVYSISSLIYNIVKKEESSGIEQILTLLTGVAYFGACYGLLDKDYHAFMGFFALILAIYYLLWAYLVKVITPKDENLYSFLAFLTVGFITLAIPIQFKQNIITIGWAIEALIILYLGFKTNSKRIVIFSFIVSTLVMARLLFIDASIVLNNFIVIFNKRFFAFFFVIITFYIASYIIKKSILFNSAENNILQLKKLLALWLIAANLLTLFSINQEIISYCQKEVNKIQVEKSKLDKEWNIYNNNYIGTNSYGKFEKYNTGIINTKIRNIEYRRSITLSLFWLLYAIILLIIGFIGRYKLVRVGGIILLALSILKLFFYDLWSLGTLYRIISSISLGIVLLLISFVYQKYKDKIKEII